MSENSSKTKDRSTTPPDDDASPPPPRRINVAVNPEMLAAIEYVIDREQVSLTEAVRRLLAYGDYVYRTAKDEESAIVVRANDGSEREVILL